MQNPGDQRGQLRFPILVGREAKRRVRDSIFSRMGKVQARTGVWLAILLASHTYALALDPSLDISQYAHTPWKAGEGLSKGITFAIAQTPDGYLWLGTEFGLLRFDGVRSVSWEPPAGQHLPSSEIRSLRRTCTWLRDFTCDARDDG